MPALRTLFHLTRVDFLERARRYSFLAVLGLTILATYLYTPPSSAHYLTLGLGNYHGIYRVDGAVAVIAALAVLFETIPWLRGTFGNVVYFILWLVLLMVSVANVPSSQWVGEPGPLGTGGRP